MKIFTFLLLFTPFVTIAAEFGNFMLVKGKVIIINSKSESAEAKVGSKIYVGETVVTDNESRAKIVMSDRNVLNILPNTKLKIEKYTSGTDAKEVQLNLIEGKVRSNVGGKYDNKSSKFEIRTATAVAGVRGTEFITSYDPATKVTEVLTIHGQVIFKSAGPADAGGGFEVLVNKQEKSEQKGETSPSKPTKVPKKEFDAINKESNVTSDKRDGKGAKKDGPRGDGTGDSDVVAGGESNSGELGTKPLENGGGFPSGGSDPVVRPPDKTRVQVIISPSPTPTPTPQPSP